MNTKWTNFSGPCFDELLLNILGSQTWALTVECLFELVKIILVEKKKFVNIQNINLMEFTKQENYVWFFKFSNNCDELFTNYSSA